MAGTSIYSNAERVSQNEIRKAEREQNKAMAEKFFSIFVTVLNSILALAGQAIANGTSL